MSLNLAYSVKEGFKGLKRVRMATFVTVSTIAITHILLGVFLFFTVHVHQLVDIMKNRVSLEVFIDNSLSTQDREDLGKAIQDLPGVRQVTYVSKDEALKKFARDTGIDPVALLGDNPLPASYQIAVDSDRHTPQGIEDVASAVQGLKGVDDVVYNSAFYKVLANNMNRALLVDGFLFGLVILSTILLVANTLRLSIFAQRTSIRIMELVGATRGFIRRPYLVQGLFQGFMGGLVGSAAMWLCGLIVRYYFPSLFSMSVPVILVPVVLGMILGYIGSSVALRRFLT